MLICGCISLLFFCEYINTALAIIVNTALTIIYCFNNIFNNIYAVLYIITNIFLTPVLFGNLEKIANCPVNKLKGDGR